MHSRIYHGKIQHARYKPVKHAFDYDLFMLYLDLDELENTFSQYWFWSVQRPNIAWFRRADHTGNPTRSLKTSIIEKVRTESGIECHGPIRLLTHLRYFGYGFNPVSFYYCFNDRDDELIAVVAEVNNTPWREQHCYVLDVKHADQQGQVLRFRQSKQFHVSPFMDQDMTYEWSLAPPSNHLNIGIRNLQQNDVIFDATLNLHAKPITSRNLAAQLLRFPCMTLSVIVRIYWQALKLWIKGVKIVDHPDQNKTKNVKQES